MALQFSVAGGDLTEISQISQMPPQHLVLVGSMWQSCCVLTLVGGNLTGRRTTLVFLSSEFGAADGLMGL